MNNDPDDDIYEDILSLLHRRARLLVSCPHEAADLAQDTVLKLWQRHINGTVPDDLVGYAMVALHNQARSRWRTRKHVQELRDDMAVTGPDAPGRIACAELEQALSRLPRTQGELMTLVAQGETSPAELARITGKPLGTIMSRLARARARLRDDLGLRKGASVASLI